MAAESPILTVMLVMERGEVIGDQARDIGLVVRGLRIEFVLVLLGYESRSKQTKNKNSGYLELFGHESLILLASAYILSQAIFYENSAQKLCQLLTLVI